MIWVSNIKDLQANHSAPGQYCYCDLMLSPKELTLQAPIPQVTAAATCNIYAYTPDGATQLADVTSQFAWYNTIVNNKNEYKWIAECISFTGAMNMCGVCFILRVVLTQSGVTIWDKYTEQYCIGNCCPEVEQVTYTQEGYPGITLKSEGNIPGEYVGFSCDFPITQIKTVFDCYSNFTKYYYGNTDVGIGGTSLTLTPYVDYTNLKATFKKAPREIVRDISQNCRTQKVERIQKWILESAEEFPLWKVEDLENMFSATHVYINGIEYVMDTATPFERIRRAYADEKYERYKLKVELRECRQFQMMGCGEECVATAEGDFANYAFVVPASVEVFFDESGNEIAYDVEGLEIYLRGIDQTTDAQIVTLSPPSSTWNILTVTGRGYLPTAIYANSFNYENKIPAILVDGVDPDYGSLIPVEPCGTFTIGTITSATETCGTFSIGIITSATMGVSTQNIIQYQDWLVDTADTQMELLEYVVKFDLDVFNSGFPIGETSPPIVPNLSGEIIAVIPYPCRPRTAQNFGHNAYSSIPEDANIIIDPSGYIIYSGPVTSADETGSTITLTNILYNL